MFRGDRIIVTVILREGEESRETVNNVIPVKTGISTRSWRGSRLRGNDGGSPAPAHPEFIEGRGNDGVVSFDRLRMSGSKSPFPLDGGRLGWGRPSTGSG